MDCPRCSLRMLRDSDGDFACLTCGCIQLAIPGLSQAQAEHEQRRGGKRSHKRAQGVRL
jgi:hypothetical protein